ncbi:MAG: agmatinase family protein [Myxococcota bacterium]
MTRSLVTGGFTAAALIVGFGAGSLIGDAEPAVAGAHGSIRGAQPAAVGAETKPTAAQESETYSFDDAWNADLERQGVIRLNPADPTYDLPFRRRDTSGDPKREPGPIYLNRQVMGSPFLGIPTFMRRPVCVTPEDLVAGDVDAAFVGLPIDFNSVRRGCLLGPQALRTAEVLTHWRSDGQPMTQHTDTMIDPLAILNVVDYGDISVEPFNLERSIGQAIPVVREAARTGTTLLICGGAHSVPYPTIRGIVEANGGKGSIGVIHFDAHQDAAPYGFGHPAHYGTFIRSLVTDELVAGEHILQVGMRGPNNASSALKFQRSAGIRTIYMADIRDRGWGAVAEQILDLVTSDGFPDKLYISLDLDFYDASVAPGTTAPEHGGVMPVDFFPLLRALSIAKPLAGIDIVEVSPMNDDRSGTTMLLASRTYFEIMVGMALRKQGVEDPWYLAPDLLSEK